MNFTYMIRCADDTFYTGWTNDLKKRFRAHCTGKGARYTRMHTPKEVMYYEVFETRQEAQQREWQIKQLNRGEKEKLAEGFEDPLKLLPLRAERTEDSSH